MTPNHSLGHAMRRIVVALLIFAGLGPAAARADEQWPGYKEREISKAEVEAFQRQPGVVAFPEQLTLQDAHYFLVDAGRTPGGHCKIGQRSYMSGVHGGPLPASEQVATDGQNCLAIFKRGLQPRK
jgi:hypothetical protein